jgi:lipopolysaccharide transport system ATP-binding protein
MYSDETVISVKNLSKCFEMYQTPSHRLWQTLCMGKKQFYKEFWALRNINFELRKGECIGIIGRNGAGKSTLLQIITGTLQQTSGEVYTKGRIAALLELGSGFNPEFSGRDNVYMNAAILGFKRSEIEKKYEEIVKFAAIGDFIDQPVKTYSSGMMVRLAFAVQVVVEPDLLIVDEALSVGDATFQFKCLSRIKEIVAGGTSVLLVSHDSGTVKSFCNKCLWLKNGEVYAYGDAGEIVDAYDREVRMETEVDVLADTSVKEMESRPIDRKLNQEVTPDTVDSVWRISSEFEKNVSGTRHGLGKGRICNLELLDEGGKSLLLNLQYDQPVIVRIYFELDEDVEDLAIYYILKDSKNIEILGAGNYVLNDSFFNLKRGRHIVDFKTSFPVTAGIYSLSAVIGKMPVANRSAYSFDYVDNAYVFNMDHRQPYRIWSKVMVQNEIKLLY